LKITENLAILFKHFNKHIANLHRYSKNTDQDNIVSFRDTESVSGLEKSMTLHSISAI
jgi:hypothetical protein